MAGEHSVKRKQEDTESTAEDKDEEGEPPRKERKADEDGSRPTTATTQEDHSAADGGDREGDHRESDKRVEGEHNHDNQGEQIVEREKVRTGQPGFALICGSGGENRARQMMAQLISPYTKGAGCSVQGVEAVASGVTYLEVDGLGEVGSESGGGYRSSKDPLTMLIGALKDFPQKLAMQPCQRALPAQALVRSSDSEGLKRAARRIVASANEEGKKYGVGIRTRKQVDDDRRRSVVESLASGVEEAMPGAKVDLSGPERALLAEVLPGAMADDSDALVAICWADTPHLFSSKGRLQIRPFAVDTAMRFIEW